MKRWLFSALAMTALGAYAADDQIDYRAANGIATHLVVGDQVWLEGRYYKSGNDWLALACDAKSCALEPARVVVRGESQPNMDDSVTIKGQSLTFTRNHPGKRKVIAWLQRNPAKPLLHPGPVTTYGSIIEGFKSPDTPGTHELSVTTPDGELSRFVPLLSRNDHRFVLQLRSQGKRQMLEQLWQCSTTGNTDYLLWAGDLDGDGRPDYLISYVDGYGEVVLYLSSEADAADLVGTAVSYQDPILTECPPSDDEK